MSLCIIKSQDGVTVAISSPSQTTLYVRIESTGVEVVNLSPAIFEDLTLTLDATEAVDIFAPTVETVTGPAPLLVDNAPVGVAPPSLLLLAFADHIIGTISCFSAKSKKVLDGGHLETVSCVDKAS